MLRPDRGQQILASMPARVPTVPRDPGPADRQRPTGTFDFAVDGLDLAEIRLAVRNAIDAFYGDTDCKITSILVVDNYSTDSDGDPVWETYRAYVTTTFNA